MKKLTAILVVLAMGGVTNAAVIFDDFESYSASAGNGTPLVGQGPWVASDLPDMIGGTSNPTVSLDVQAGVGFGGGQAATSFPKLPEGFRDGAAARDLGVSLGSGSTVSVLAKAPDRNGYVALIVGNSTLVDGTRGNEVAYWLSTGRIGTNSMGAAMFEHDGQGNAVFTDFGPINAGPNDWLVLQFTLTDSGAKNGLDGGSVAYRNIALEGTGEVGDAFETLGALTEAQANGFGLGAGNTFVALGTFEDSNSPTGNNVLDNLDVTNIPEPAALFLLGIGSLAALLKRRRSYWLA